MPTSTSFHFMIPAKEIITASELVQFQYDFHQHFRQYTSHGLEVLRNTRRAVPVELLEQKFPSHAQGYGGLYISYGMSDGSFIPILEAVQLDAAHPSGYRVQKGSACVIGEKGLVGITDQLRDQLVANYLQGVHVKRTTDGDYQPLNGDPVSGDPRGLHFNEQRMLALLNDNPIVEDRHLVITALAAEMTMGGKEETSQRTEFVHTIGLHLARPINIGDNALVLKDLVNDDPAAQGYAMRAADLGNVCPPHCVGGKP